MKIIPYCDVTCINGKVTKLPVLIGSAWEHVIEKYKQHRCLVEGNHVEHVCRYCQESWE